MRSRNKQTRLHRDPARRRSCRCPRRSSEISRHLVPGLYYGLGTGLAGLLFWWIQQMM